MRSCVPTVANEAEEQTDDSATTDTEPTDAPDGEKTLDEIIDTYSK